MSACGSGWLSDDTIGDYCIRRGKLFVCNNVPVKASDEFQPRFRKEPYVEHFRSLMILPITIEGEVLALLRLMSTDEDCFLDRHAIAMQDIAFVVG